MDYAWSSVACGYALTAGKRAKWLAVGEGLRELGYTDTAAGRREFVRGLDRRAAEEVAERAGVPVEDAEADRRMSSLRRGWYWGSQAFAEGMLKLGEATLKKGAPPRIPCQWGKPRAWPARGGAVAGAGIASRGVNDRELAVKPGSSLIKVAIARVIWENTQADLRWIASHLAMKSPENASQQLRRQPNRKTKLPIPLQKWVNL